jgi:hypothetical protein
MHTHIPAGTGLGKRGARSEIVCEEASRGEFRHPCVCASVRARARMGRGGAATVIPDFIMGKVLTVLDGDSNVFACQI